MLILVTQKVRSRLFAPPSEFKILHQRHERSYRAVFDASLHAIFFYCPGLGVHLARCCRGICIFSTDLNSSLTNIPVTGQKEPARSTRSRCLLRQLELHTKHVSKFHHHKVLHDGAGKRRMAILKPLRVTVKPKN
jgi:hypothetical protein